MLQGVYGRGFGGIILALGVSSSCKTCSVNLWKHLHRDFIPSAYLEFSLVVIVCSLRRGYLQFLVDSKTVYEALEEACASESRLAEFRETGLERSTALARDIVWMLETYPDALPEGGQGGNGRAPPPPTAAALEYAAFLRETVASSLPAFMCHYYNYYFAHTAGGRMIGRKVADR